MLHGDDVRVRLGDLDVRQAAQYTYQCAGVVQPVHLNRRRVQFFHTCLVEGETFGTASDGLSAPRRSTPASTAACAVRAIVAACTAKQRRAGPPLECVPGSLGRKSNKLKY